MWVFYRRVSKTFRVFSESRINIINGIPLLGFVIVRELFGQIFAIVIVVTVHVVQEVHHPVAEVNSASDNELYYCVVETWHAASKIIYVVCRV
jgi:hypothetical protein